jgi:hypothetical protein
MPERVALALSAEDIACLREIINHDLDTRLKVDLTEEDFSVGQEKERQRRLRVFSLDRRLRRAQIKLEG